MGEKVARKDARKKEQRQPRPAPRAVLIWSRPRLLRRDYELRQGDRVLAWLCQVGILNPRTEIYQWDAPDPKAPVLIIQRSGIFRQWVHMSSRQRLFPPVKKAPLSSGGDLAIALPDGRQFFWETNFWQSTWRLKDEAERVILVANRDTWSDGGELHVYDHNLAAADLNFLIFVCWYVVILKIEDAMAAVVASTAAIG